MALINDDSAAEIDDIYPTADYDVALFWSELLSSVFVNGFQGSEIQNRAHHTRI